MDTKTEVEMTEEKKPEAEKPQTLAAKTEGAVDTKPEVGADVLAELEKTRKALKEANKEAAERRKRLEELEAAETKRKEAEMTEADKVQVRLKELEAQRLELENKVKAQERRELQRKVAKSVDLPEGLAERLKGETEEEMTEDAKAILELMPKFETKKPDPPKQTVVNPNEAERGKTRAERKSEIFGTRVDTFSPDFVRGHGGGVAEPGK